MRPRLLLSLPFLLLASPASAQTVDFNREVRPILAGKCFLCHGPDVSERKAGLRLDLRDGATAVLKSGMQAVVPGNPGKSELLVRVLMADGKGMMPPIKAGKRLSEQEAGVLRRWIEQGAKYDQHWSYVKLARPPLPAVKDQAWIVNPIDRFILARLEKEGLKPQPAADKFALLRRVALDLTGLPPTIEEAERFLADTSPDAYEKLVDRLLAAPGYGERWAQSWLDMARYADSQGFANDPDRTIWRYRDWVIQALNENLPFDQFTIQQLAGDLLPQATPSQLIATGFHRNTLTNTEGGTNAEEFRSAAVVDRVNTTMQVWMATTIACSQCHNHKYDPLSQKEFFQLYAILNNTEDANSGNDAPILTVAVVGKEKEYEAAAARLVVARKALDEETPRIDAGRLEWELSIDPATLPKELLGLVELPVEKRDKAKDAKLLAYYRSLSDVFKPLDAEVKTLEAQVKTLGTTTPILREGKPRVTHIQIRGNFLDKGDKVDPGLPEVFKAPKAVNRLELAKWLVSEDNPLTARVAVNRLWEEIFGIGIVETSEDFGIQGELPSHPELLDWLAMEYLTGKGEPGASAPGGKPWDTKRLLKLLVTSAAYKQSSQTAPELAKRDPNNRLLARGPRVRLSGESVRDQALFAAGLLNRKMFGPPVQPPKPNFGLAAAFGSSTDWQGDATDERFRRGLYIRWRRNAPYPSLTTFDAPERTVCSPRRIRTNTPLQALVTLNDPCFFEAAQGLARRVVAQPGDTEKRVTYAFRLVLTRPPAPQESKRLVDLFDQARKQFSSEPENATKIATKPLGPAPKGVDIAELAAWTVIGNVLLNLDETIAKR